MLAPSELDLDISDEVPRLVLGFLNMNYCLIEAPTRFHLSKMYSDHILDRCHLYYLGLYVDSTEFIIHWHYGFLVPEVLKCEFLLPLISFLSSIVWGSETRVSAFRIWTNKVFLCFGRISVSNGFLGHLSWPSN